MKEGGSPVVMIWALHIRTATKSYLAKLNVREHINAGTAYKLVGSGVSTGNSK